MVRFRSGFGFAAAAVLMAALALPASTTLAAPVSGDGARKQATERLFSAVHANDYSAVQASIGAGADVEAMNGWGITAADLAIDKGYFRIAHYLVSVRNFQRGKAEQAASAAATTPTGGTAASTGATRSIPATAEPRSAANPPVHAGRPTMPAPTPAASTPAAPTRTMVPASDLSGVDDGVNPFDPKAPAYGATVPAASN